MDAKKVRYGPTALPGLLTGIDQIISLKGKKIDELKMKEEPEEAALLALLLGPTGNLRAPSARVGRTLIVGFNAETYAKELK